MPPPTPSPSSSSSSSSSSTTTPSPSPSSSSQEVVQFLNRVLPQAGPDALPYEEDLKLTIRHHLVSLTQEFPSLQIKTESFTHNDGTVATLLQASGTIPMYYLKVLYNIPASIWLPERYPKCPPLAYVSPTRDMIVKRPHPHVDPSGLISVPYLQGWIYPRSSLIELVRELSLIFGQNPPLYSKPPSYSPPPPPLTGSYPTMQHHHRPSATSSSSSSLSSSFVPSIRPNSSSLSSSVRPSSSYLASKVSDPSSEAFRRDAISTLMNRVHNDVNALKKKKESADMEKLMSMQAVLKQRGDQCNEGYRSLQREKEALEHQLQLILTNTDVLETWIEENKKSNMEFDIDDVFEPCDALSKQLLECTCADLALEDIFYALDRAMQEGTIPVDAYLKHVRSLAREQFFHKAMAEKVRAMQAQTQIDIMAARAGRYNR